MNKQEREKAGLLRRADVVKKAGISRGMLDYHISQGTVPAGVVVSGDLLFTEQMTAAIVEFFGSRKKWAKV